MPTSLDVNERLQRWRAVVAHAVRRDRNTDVGEAPRLPVVLCHGLLGFDYLISSRRLGLRREFMAFQYFSGTLPVRISATLGAERNAHVAASQGFRKR
jgi:hypothetical protein